ncbi:MAG: alpha/beta fold hydrolase [Smithellaceae bacterium]|nr:alpha/beta fold hydrolase [Smithellaceae bacterium]
MKKKEPLRVFIHGLESTARGTKGRYFRRHYQGMIIANYRGPFEERMAKLEKILDRRSDLILIGSSYGGVMAAAFACLHKEKVRRLILLAPALHLPEFIPYRKCRLQIPTVLYHARQDDVVPPTPVYKVASAVFDGLDYHLVDGDHPLRETFPKIGWNELLEINNGT